MNDFEQRRQEAKARAIVRSLLRDLHLPQRVPEYADVVAGFPQDRRDYVVARATADFRVRAKTCSQTTWLLACDMIREQLTRETAEPRCGASYQAGPFEPEHVCGLADGHLGYCSSGRVSWPQDVGARRIG